jgi:hypothetical protein
VLIIDDDRIDDRIDDGDDGMMINSIRKVNILS